MPAPSAIGSASAPRRAMDLLVRVLTDRGEVGLRMQAAALRLPLSTAYRWASQLQRAGLISRIGRGTFTVGFDMHGLTSGTSRTRLLADISRPHVRALAQRLKLLVG
jgi:DNA-binding IclR family transcriptional regulator